jgi:hypothetical protein
MSYTVKQSDMDKGSIINLAIAKATFGTQEVTSAEATAYVITYVGARLTLTITSTPTSFQNKTSPLSINFILSNTGSVSLTSPYTISTNSFLTVSCASAISPLPFGQQTECTAFYTPTSADLATGSISITGTATAKYLSTVVTSNTANLTIPSSFVCSTSHGTPDITFPRTNQMAVDITNSISTSDSITLKSIQLANWNFGSPGGQYLSSIVLGSVQIYSGSAANAVDPFAISTFSGTATIAPGQTKTLVFAFSKNYHDTGDELITITFAEYGCATLIAGD